MSDTLETLDITDSVQNCIENKSVIVRRIYSPIHYEDGVTFAAKSQKSRLGSDHIGYTALKDLYNILANEIISSMSSDDCTLFLYEAELTAHCITARFTDSGCGKVKSCEA